MIQSHLLALLLSSITRWLELSLNSLLCILIRAVPSLSVLVPSATSRAGHHLIRHIPLHPALLFHRALEGETGLLCGSIFLSPRGCGNCTVTARTGVQKASCPLFTHQNSKQCISRNAEINGGNFSLIVNNLPPGSCLLG